MHKTELILKDFIAKPLFQSSNFSAKDLNWPKISIVTPSFNQGQFIERTILSVLNQNYPNLEYIIMDDGSIDNSEQIIKKYANFLSFRISKVNQGQAFVLREGFRLASGYILGSLNADDIYLPGTLNKVGKFFMENESIDVLYGHCLVLDSEDRVIRTMYPPRFDRNIFLFENQIIPQPTAFWRREIYEKVGGVDPQFEYCLDYDLFQRFLLQGAKISMLKTPLAGYRWHRDSKTSRLQHIRKIEHKKIVERTIQRPLNNWDYFFRIPLLRLKRYFLSPRSFFEGIRVFILRLSVDHDQ